MNHVRGFASVIAQQLEPLKENEQFKKDIATMKPMKILINSINNKHAALVTIENSNIIVESIENTPSSNISKANLGWNAMVSCHTQVVFGLALGRLSMLELLVKVLKGEVKVRGIGKLLVLKKMFTYLAD